MTIFNRRGAQNPDPDPGNSHSGVYNSGGSMGNVQNQPGATGSSQNMVNISGSTETAAQWTRVLEQLDTALVRHRDDITDPEGCRMLLGLIQQQPVADEGGRLAARSMLGRLGEMCAGAGGVITLINSASALLGFGTG